MLDREVLRAFEDHGRRYGRPRIHRELRSRQIEISEQTVYRIMKENRLKARKKTGYRPRTTQSGFPEACYPNLLKDYEATAPSQAVVTDMTYMATREGWLYLSAVMDLYSKSVKGHCMSDSLDASGSLKALHYAMRRDPRLRGAIHHSDRGCQYTSRRYRAALSRYRLSGSMSAQAIAATTPISRASGRL